VSLPQQPAEAPPRRVLVVDDESQIVRALRVVLREAGFEAVPAETAAEALDLAALRPPDAAIVDLVLPDGDGVEVTRRLREWSEMPILVLSALGEEEQKVRALEAGADDYITKPFDARELTARVRAHLRRAEGTPAASRREGLLVVGGVQVDTESRRVRIAEEEIQLTMTEFNLLALLAANAGRVLTRAQLLEKVWGYLADVDYHSVDPHMQRLRRKLNSQENARVALEAVPGLGYRLTPLV
jgi:two-component system KDP operon response regulator KdpE